MTTSILPPELPASYAWGFVVGQIIHAIADQAGDADRHPEARAATGTVLFTPLELLRRVTTEPTAFVAHAPVTAKLGTTGELVDADAQVGIWLVTGSYRVSFELGGAVIPPFDIDVTAAHTLVAPLDLVTVAPYTPPAGTTVTTMLVPAGPTEGQVLGWASGALTWVAAGAATSHTHAASQISDSTATGRTLMTAATAIAARTAISAAPALGSDDNYVTDAEKASLHTHPAVIAQGDTATAARTAIGAGTSNLTIGTTGTTAKAGNYAPPAATITAQGIVELATTAETTEGTDATRAVTPAALKAVADTKAPATQPINAQTAAYTLTASDAGKLVTVTAATAVDVTVPAGVFTAGQRVDVLDLGTERVTFVAGAGMTLSGTPTLVSRAQYSAHSVVFLSASEAVVVGDLEAA